EEATDLELRRALHRQIALCQFLRNQASRAAAECDSSAVEQVGKAVQAQIQAEAALAYLASAELGVAVERANGAVSAGQATGDVVSVCLAESVLSRIDAFNLDFSSSIQRADAAVLAAAADPTGEAGRNQPGFFRLLSLLDLDRLDDASAEL